MSVVLEIDNIGGLQGKHRFSFQKGRLNIIESPNAAGKTSIIKSLAAVLSLPGITYATIEEMVRLGLRASDSSVIDPLINIYSDSAGIKLKMNGEEFSAKFQKWKEPIINPKGNEKFVFAGFLTRESKVVRNLAEGNDDFMWIVDTMSLAQRYEEAQSQVEKSLTEALISMDEIKKKKKEIDTINQKIEKAESERISLKKEYEFLGAELRKTPAQDPKLKTLFESVSERERQKEQEVRTLEIEVAKAEKELMEPRMELSSIEREIAILQKTRDDLLEDLRRIPQDADIKKMLQRVDKIEREEVPNLREERGKKVGVFNLLDSALRVMEHGEKVCPLCGSSGINIEKMYNQKEELKKQIAKLDREIGELLIEADRLRGETIEIDKKKKDKQKDIDKVERELQDKTAKKKELEREVLYPQRKLESRKADLERAKQELKSIKEELRKIEREMKEKETKVQDLLVRRERLEERLLIIDKELEEEKRALQQASLIVVNEIPMSIEKAEFLYAQWIHSLEEVVKHLENRSKEQRQGAARRFNSEVKNLVAKLGFSEFEQILLNEETYKLQVFRKGGLPQAISSLSGSERNALGTLLQLAIKEAYVPEIPFFIVDEVVLDFDKTRVEKIFEYLAELARERNWCVVITRLGGESRIEVKQA